MNDSQKIGMLARQLKEALRALDIIASWDVLTIDPNGNAMQARLTLGRIRGGDGRPPSKVSR